MEHIWISLGLLLVGISLCSDSFSGLNLIWCLRIIDYEYSIFIFYFFSNMLLRMNVDIMLWSCKASVKWICEDVITDVVHAKR